MSLEIFIWIIVGGILVAGLGAGSLYYINETPTNKQLSRDFIIGALFTGFLYPLIPESFDEIKVSLDSAASVISSTYATGSFVDVRGTSLYTIEPSA